MALQEILNADILVLNSKIRVDREAIDLAEKLKLVVRAGVGTDHIDGAYLAEKGIKLQNCAGANADAVAEQTMAMLLVIRNNLLRADREVRQFIWRREENRGHELTAKTVGIIGFGHTGSQVAKRLQGFGCKILAYDKYKTAFGNAYVEEVQMERIFAEADVLSLHIPLTTETRELVDSDYIARFAKPFHLLNLARGPIVHLPSLLDALNQGKIKGAALDVLPNEKMHVLSPEEKVLYQALFDQSNVIFAPHIGGWTFESLSNIEQRVLREIQAVFS